MKTLVLKNCRLIPYLTEGFVVQENQLADVVIEDKRIKTILPAGTAFEGDVDILDVKGDFQKEPSLQESEYIDRNGSAQLH